MRLLKIEKLPNSKVWIDKDLIMFHACFQCLKDFVEKQNFIEYVKYFEEEVKKEDCSQDTLIWFNASKEGFYTILDLYNWYISFDFENELIDDSLEEETLGDKKLKELMKYRRWLWS